MSHFLMVGAGPYQFLLDAKGVHEIVDVAELKATAGRCDWRGRVLPMVDARTLLGVNHMAPRTARVGVVYSVAADAAPVMLELDGVPRWRCAAPAEFLLLPAVPDATFRLFDSVLPDAQTGLQVYRLRRPLDTELLAGPVVAHHDTDVLLPTPPPTVGAAPPAPQAPRRRRKKR